MLCILYKGTQKRADLKGSNTEDSGDMDNRLSAINCHDQKKW